MMENRISGLKCDTDVFVTFEGDNVVVLSGKIQEMFILLKQHHFQDQEFSRNLKCFMCFIFLDWQVFSCQALAS